MVGQFSANASALGYFYQARYALWLLIEAGRSNLDAEMSLERFDDVAFHNAEDPVALIQTKHHIVDNQSSLSDSSPDLWKTIRIWCTESLRQHWHINKITFMLVTTALASSGSIASKLRSEDTGCRDIEGACILLRKIAVTSRNQDNRLGYEAFLKLTDNEQLTLLNNTYVLDASPNILDVRSKILTELRYQAINVESFYERLEGWWFRKIIEHLSYNSQGTISHRHLMNTITDYQQQLYKDNLPIDFLGPIDIEAQENMLIGKQRIFIEQLHLVNVKMPRIKLAISDYHKAYKQRSKWVREELLLIEELIKYENRLCDE